MGDKVKSAVWLILLLPACGFPQFFKDNWVWMSIVILVGVSALVITIVAIVKKGNWDDNAFMQTPDGKPIHWHRSLPLPVWFDYDIDGLWLEAWVKASKEFERVIGRAVFMHPLEAHPDLEYPVSDSIVLMDDDGISPEHAETVLRWNEEGHTLSAVIVFPEAHAGSEYRYSIALHEAGHALGLEHDESKESIMYPYMQDRPKGLTKQDEKRLKKVYG